MPSFGRQSCSNACKPWNGAVNVVCQPGNCSIAGHMPIWCTLTYDHKTQDLGCAQLTLRENGCTYAKTLLWVSHVCLVL